MAASDKLLPSVKPGDKVPASGWNDIVGQLNALGGYRGPANERIGPAGRFIGEIGQQLLRVIVAKVGDTAVPAIEGTTPGSARLPLYRFNATDGLVPVTKRDGSEVEQTVYNISASDSPTDAYVLVYEEQETGRLVIVLGGGADTDNTGFPPGTGGCVCDHCVEGVTIPNALECCKSHLQWSFKNPWLTCETTDLTLEYIGDDQWISEVFEGPDCADGATTLKDEFQWLLTIDITGLSYLTLQRKTDNGCPDVCVIYGKESFDCQCDNQFFLKKPYGTVIGVERDELSCYACLKPALPIAIRCHERDFPEVFSYEWPCEGVDEFGSPCGVDTSPGNCGGGLFQFAEGGSVNLGSVFSQGASCAWDGNLELGDVGSDCCFLGLTLLFFDTTTNICDAHWMILVNWYDPSFMGGNIQWEYCPDENGFDPAVGGTFVPANCYDCPGNDYPCAEIVVTSPFGFAPPTSDGVCNETCSPPTPPVDPAGACCYQGTCYSFWDESLCDDFGGEWHADAADCVEACEATTACCINGVCTVINPFLCNYLVGTPMPGSDCSDDPCNEDGACCRDDDSCEITTEDDCQGAGDWWNGVGTACEDFDCTVGACCYTPEGIIIGDPCFCEEISHAECDTRDTVREPDWGGDGTTCAGLGAGNCIEDGPCVWDL